MPPPARHPARSSLVHIPPASPTPPHITRTATHHPFNHTLTLLLPAGVPPPTVPSAPPYLRLRRPAAFLLSPAILPQLHRPALTLLTRGRIDVDPLLAVSHAKLRLSLDNATYERVGLQGTKVGRRWLLEVPVEKVKEGRRELAGVRRALEMLGEVDILCVGLDVEGEEVREVKREEVVRRVKIPGMTAPEGRLAGGEWEREVWAEWGVEMEEWLGLVELGADRVAAGDNVDSLLSAYSVEDAVEGEVRVLTWRGVLGGEWVAGLWRRVEESLEGREEWAGMCVHGFEGVPVGWGGAARNGVGRSGDGFTVLRLPMGQGTMLYKLIGGQEQYS